MISKVKVQRSAIGLDIDGHEFKAVQLERDGQESRVAAWAVFPRLNQEDVTQDASNPLPDQKELAWAASILNRRGFSGREVSLAVPSRFCTQHQFELPPKESGAPIDVLAKAEVARERKCDPHEIELGHWALPQRGRTTETMAIACTQNTIRSMADGAHDAGLEVVGIDLSELTVLRAAQRKLPDSSVDGNRPIHAVLHFGWGHSTVVVTLGNQLSYVRRIHQGAQSVWEQARAKFGLSENGARAVLGDIDIHDGDEQLSKIRAACWKKASAQIASELDVAFAYVSHAFRMAPMGHIALCGYGSQSQTLRTQLDQIMGVPLVDTAVPELLNAVSGQGSASVASRLVYAYGLAARYDA